MGLETTIAHIHYLQVRNSGQGPVKVKVATIFCAPIMPNEIAMFSGIVRDVLGMLVELTDTKGWELEASFFCAESRIHELEKRAGVSPRVGQSYIKENVDDARQEFISIAKSILSAPGEPAVESTRDNSVTRPFRRADSATECPSLTQIRVKWEDWDQAKQVSAGYAEDICNVFAGKRVPFWFATPKKRWVNVAGMNKAADDTLRNYIGESMARGSTIQQLRNGAMGQAALRHMATAGAILIDLAKKEFDVLLSLDSLGPATFCGYLLRTIPQFSENLDEHAEDMDAGVESAKTPKRIIGPVTPCQISPGDGLKKSRRLTKQQIERILSFYAQISPTKMSFKKELLFSMLNILLDTSDRIEGTIVFNVVSCVLEEFHPFFLDKEHAETLNTIFLLIDNLHDRVLRKSFELEIAKYLRIEKRYRLWLQKNGCSKSSRSRLPGPSRPFSSSGDASTGRIINALGRPSTVASPDVMSHQVEQGFLSPVQPIVLPFQYPSDHHGFYSIMNFNLGFFPADFSDYSSQVTYGSGYLPALEQPFYPYQASGSENRTMGEDAFNAVHPYVSRNTASYGYQRY